MKTLIKILCLSVLWFSCSDPNCVEGDCENGQGTYKFSNGKKYVGEWKDGMMHGQGTMMHLYGIDGSYVGEWKDGMMHGQGTITWGPSTEFYGDKYIGEIKNELMHGEGTYLFANGDTYVGEWKDGLRHGQGTYTYSNGKILKGQWFNDKLINY